MSARDTARIAITQWAETREMDERMADWLLDAYRDEVRHEAAEQIRNVPEALMVGRRDRDVLADLIDPEVPNA